MEFIYFLCYLVIINFVTAILFLVDKLKAKANAFRISEKTLLLFCATGGAVGGLFGMVVFNHKSKKPKFFLTIPLLIIIHFAIVWFAFLR